MYDNEAGLARAVIIELYEGLKEGYSNLGFRDDYFEWDFIKEYAWLPRAIAQIKKEFPPFERSYIDFHVDELCKMERAILELEKELTDYQ